MMMMVTHTEVVGELGGGGDQSPHKTTTHTCLRGGETAVEALDVAYPLVDGLRVLGRPLDGADLFFFVGCLVGDVFFWC